MGLVDVSGWAFGLVGRSEGGLFIFGICVKTEELRNRGFFVALVPVSLRTVICIRLLSIRTSHLNQLNQEYWCSRTDQLTNGRHRSKG